MEKKDFELNGTIAKYDDERGQCFGIFSVEQIGDSRVVDEEGDRIVEGELEKAAYDHVKEARIADVNHDGSHVGDLIESMVFTPEKCQALEKALRASGIQATIDIPATVWWGGHQINNEEVRKAVKSGRYRYFSIGGSGVREPVNG